MTKDTTRDPLKDTILEMQRAILRDGLDQTVKNMASVLVAQARELERKTEVIDEIADCANVMEKSRTKILMVLRQYFDVEELDEDEETGKH